MAAGRRGKVGLAIAVMGGGIVALAATWAAGAKNPESGPLEVVAPPDRAVLMSGTFDVICRGDAPDLRVDARKIPWEPFEPPVHVARVHLTPGQHLIEAGDRRLVVVVALNEDEHEGPADWKIFRSHPIEPGKDRCGDCHQTEQTDGRVRVGEFSGYQACLDCHTPVDFEVIHSHILEPLEPCQMCHAMHGSHYDSLLKAPTRKLCEECHDPEH